MKKRILAVLLTAATFLGAVACTGSNQAEETDSPVTARETAQDTEPGTDLETVPETEADTAELWDKWEPVPGAEVTELTISGTVADTGSGNETNRETTYAYEPNSTVYSLKEANGKGSTVTLKNSTVSALRLSTVFKDGTVAKYQGKVQMESVPADANWCSLFIGLRLSDPSLDATSQTGIWLALKSDQIGMRTNDWAETTLKPIKPAGVNFSTARTLYIEDDMAADVIKLFADNDSGERVELCTVKLENGKINFYQPGESEPAISDPIATSINPNGCLSLWLHHTKNPATLTDVKAVGVLEEKFTAPQANLYAGRDILSDTWVSVDDEGRISGTENGPVGDKKVGIFYFLWHDGSSTQPIYDHAKAFAEGGSSLLIETMKSGPLGFAHYWAEPYFGYYRADDEWVIRKHTYQLNAAGVDFIFVDATNGHTYEHNYETILKVWSEMRAEGHKTPQIMFHCGNTQGLAQSSFSALWNNLYSCGRYEDLWFKHEGKPLILMPRVLYASLTPEQQEFFTYRQSWANTKDSWYTGPHGRNCWPWADMYPQKPGLSQTGEVEQMIVMCGFWVNGSYGTNAGRSYSYRNGGQPAPDSPDDFSFSLVNRTSGKGIAFEEQFDYAIEQDPGLIMITGWNEWWAGRWEAGAAIGQTIANSYVVTDDSSWTRNYFVDCFSPEHSRDIEPVKGYFNDNYYYQMVQNIRQYKGSRIPLAAFGQRPIDMSGALSQWDIVGPEFRDYRGDVTHRDAFSYVGQLHYTNDSGRNDFTTAKVSVYEGKVYFFAECAAPITAAAGTNWMNLYIDADCDAATGWEGFDYILNRSRTDKTVSVERFTGTGWEIVAVGEASYTLGECHMIISVEKSLIGYSEGDSLNFKWADNARVETSDGQGDIMRFMTEGDCAPNDRFVFTYQASGVTDERPVETESDTTPLPPPETDPVPPPVTDPETDPATIPETDPVTDPETVPVTDPVTTPETESDTDAAITTPDTPAHTDAEKKEGGCKSSLAAVAVLTSGVGVTAALVLRRRREE